MDPDGSNQTRLTDNKANYTAPTWSFDSKKILFDSDETSRWGIYIMNNDGTDKKPFKVESPWKENILANWSPDGSKIAFTSKKLMGWQVHAMNADGSDEKQLTKESGSCRPHWSPDSKKIAYVSNHGDGKGDIWLMDPNGSNKTRVTTDPNYDYHPSWSPDGTKIVYANTPDKKRGNWELYIINVDGTNPVRLTNSEGIDNHPDWK
jgi:TolB protein